MVEPVVHLPSLDPEDIQQVLIELADDAAVDVGVLIDVVAVGFDNLRGGKVHERVNVWDPLALEYVSMDLRRLIHRHRVVAVRGSAVDSLLRVVVSCPLLACQHSIARVRQQMETVTMRVTASRLQGIQTRVQAVPVDLSLQRHVTAGQVRALVGRRPLLDGVGAVNQAGQAPVARPQGRIRAHLVDTQVAITDLRSEGVRHETDSPPHVSEGRHREIRKRLGCKPLDRPP